MKTPTHEETGDFEIDFFESTAEDELNCGRGFLGTGAEERTGFVATCHELHQLVKYWTERMLDKQWFIFLYAQSSSNDFQERHYAGLRIGRIAEGVGEEQAKEAMAEAKEEFRESVDQRLWEIFIGGDPLEWRRVQEEIHAKMVAQEETV